MRLPKLAGEDRRRRLKWVFFGAVTMLAAAGSGFGGVAAQPEDELDWRTAPNALDARLRGRADNEGNVDFRWRLEARGDNVRCRLDADGDGEFDHLLDRCEDAQGVRHAFAEPGVYFATLVARSADGRAGLARARIEIP